MEALYYYAKEHNKVICLKDGLYRSYQCHRYDNGEERVSFIKKEIPEEEKLKAELQKYTPCDQERYETTIQDFFGKVKEYRDIFWNYRQQQYELNNPKNENKN